MADRHIENVLIPEQDGERVVALDAEVVAKTAKALLVRVKGSKPKWVPLDLIDNFNDFDNKAWPGDKGPLVVPLWFAREKGWM